MNEDSHFNLEDYWKSVVALRTRGWSWREIADWLTRHGLKIDHSSVFRFSQKNLAVRLCCLSEKDFEVEANELILERASEIVDSEEFAGAMATTNCCGFMIEEVEIGKRDYSDNSALIFEAHFESQGDRVEDMAYTDDIVTGSVLVSVNIDGDIDLEVFAATLDDRRD